MNNSIREWTNEEVAVFNSPVFTSMVEKTANYFTTFGETELGRVIATYPPYATCFDLNSRQLALTTLMSVSLSGVTLEDETPITVRHINRQKEEGFRPPFLFCFFCYNRSVPI